MPYHLIFDTATAGYDAWMFPAMGLIGVLIGAALVFAPNVMQTLMPGGLQGGSRRFFAWCFFLFAVAWTVLATSFATAQQMDLRSASRRNDCQQVTGVVTNFVPMPYAGHSMESFQVSGVLFEFSDYVITGGFNQTASHGGPIRPGLPVRICYVRRSTSDSNIIIRLEAAP